jgi:hypothetical protein
MSEQERIRHRASFTRNTRDRRVEDLIVDVHATYTQVPDDRRWATDFVLTDGRRDVYLTHGLFRLIPELRGVNTHAANLR